MKFQREYLCIIAQQEMAATNEEIIAALKSVGLNVQTIQTCQLDELDRAKGMAVMNNLNRFFNK